jgi:hypothetical protein
LVDQGVVIGEVCHIRASSPGGPRFDPTLSEAERDKPENLVLLCPKHHKIVDKNEGTYDVVRLTEMKAAHESQDARFNIGDELATKLVLMAWGGTIGAALIEIKRSVEEIRDLLGKAGVSTKEGPGTKSERLKSTRRYPGTAIIYADEGLPKELAAFIASQLLEAGWKVFEGKRPENLGPQRDAIAVLLVHNELGITELALGGILELLEGAGFRFSGERFVGKRGVVRLFFFTGREPYRGAI